VHPHKSSDDKVAYTLGASIIFVTMFASLLDEAQYSDSSGRVISILLVALNVVLALMALAQGVHAAKVEPIVESIPPVFIKGPAA
jgi:hypothetical protein